MAMTKKDFEAIAAEFDYVRHVVETEGERLILISIAVGIAHRCAAANPNFNRSRFLKACGILEGE